VVNRYRKNMHTCTVSMVEKRLHQKVSIIVPNDYHSVRNALDTGKPLAKRNPVRSAIRQAAVRLAGQEIASKRKSWLAKLGIGQ
jgi:Flp pilus assembly CpaE family ATPase